LCVADTDRGALDHHRADSAGREPSNVWIRWHRTRLRQQGTREDPTTTAAIAKLIAVPLVEKAAEPEDQKPDAHFVAEQARREHPVNPSAKVQKTAAHSPDAAFAFGLFVFLSLSFTGSV